MGQYRTRRQWPHEYFIDGEKISAKEIRKWCKDNCGGSHHVLAHNVITPILENLKTIAIIVRIQELEDAVLFKLRWSQLLA